jgi:hypothetical protein
MYLAHDIHIYDHPYYRLQVAFSILLIFHSGMHPNVALKEELCYRDTKGFLTLYENSTRAITYSTGTVFDGGVLAEGVHAFRAHLWVRDALSSYIIGSGRSVLLSVSSTGIEHVVNRVVLGLRKVRAISLPASVVGAKPRTY